MNLWRWSALAVTVLCLHAGAGAAPAPRDLAGEELKKLAGEWQMARFVHDGVEVDSVTYYIRVEGSRLSRMELGSRDKVFSMWSIKLNVKRKPKEIDLVRLDSKKREVARGLYHLDGEMLTVCLRRSEDPRPRKLDGTETRGTWYEVFRRVKPSEAGK
jgi:uncharacterized protein (TIGR03067 family)